MVEPVKKTTRSAAKSTAAKEPKSKEAKAAAAPQTAAAPQSKATAKVRAPVAAAKPAKKAAPAKRAVAKIVTRTVAQRSARPRPEVVVATPRTERAAPRPLPTAPAGQAPLLDNKGASSGLVEMPAALTQLRTRSGVLFQAFTAARANARQGTAATRNRARVRGGGAKPWAQKGTGRARQGSIRAPHWRHGGVVFGPNGRTYNQRLPEKMKHAAFAEAFASRSAAGRVLVFDDLPAAGETRSTRSMVDWLSGVGDIGKTVLVTSAFDATAVRATANIPRVAVRSVESLQLFDLLRFETIICARAALDGLASRAGGSGASVEGGR